MGFSTRLAELLSAKNLSQNELAKRCGICQQTVNKWLNTNTSPLWDHVSRVAAALGVSTEEFRPAEERMDWRKNQELVLSVCLGPIGQQGDIVARVPVFVPPAA